jgi:hypothetical protein
MKTMWNLKDHLSFPRDLSHSWLIHDPFLQFLLTFKRKGRQYGQPQSFTTLREGKKKRQIFHSSRQSRCPPPAPHQGFRKGLKNTKRRLIHRKVRGGREEFLKAAFRRSAGQCAEIQGNHLL